MHPPAPAQTPTTAPEVTPAAVVGALLLAAVIAAFVWLAVQDDAMRTRVAAAAEAQRDAVPMSEADRIRRALLNAQAAAERVWRNSTPPEQRRAQEAATLARFHAEDDAVVTMQRLRQLGDTGTPASAVSPR